MNNNQMKQSIYKYILLFISLFLLGNIAQSQNTDFQEKEKAIYDSLTFHYYEAGVWDSVIDIGKEAIYKGHNFYYLRMRMGLAYDYQGNFRLAEKQYKEALKLVPTDVNAAYYNYYAAVNGGRKHVAYSDFKSYNLEQAKSINKESDSKNNYLYEDHRNINVQKIKTKAIDRLYLAYGYSITGNDNKLADIYPNHGGILYTEGNIRLNQSYLNFSVGGNLSSMIEWNLSYNNGKINATKLIQPRDTSHLSVPISVLQNELFAGIKVFTGNGWNIRMTGQILHYNTNYITVINSITYEVPEDSNDTLLTEKSQYGFTDAIIKGNDYVLGLFINKKIALFDFSLFGSYASILDINPYQLGGEITILPKGNYSLYLTNRLFFYHDELSERFIYKVSAGSSLAEKMKVDASATFGNLQFTNEPGIPVVYNWAEKTTFKGDIVFSYLINTKLSLSLRYQFTQKQSLYNYYAIDEILPSTELNGYYYTTYKEESAFYNFNQHFVILSLNLKL